MQAHTIEGITEEQVHAFAEEIKKAGPDTFDMAAHEKKIKPKYTGTSRGPAGKLLHSVASAIMRAQSEVNEARFQAGMKRLQARQDQVGRTSHGVVRFGDDGRLGVNGVAPEYQWNEDKKKEEKTIGADWAPRTNPALWVKVVDGWAKDGHWGATSRSPAVPRTARGSTPRTAG
ncbi:hypothetical protein [Streptomyces nojiriensis]|nr:hypothetical protein [Streptomyces nojiriensis]QTI42288.1 hypothetical protein JYK04_00045 [Streptomyces nojiriensis]